MDSNLAPESFDAADDVDLFVAGHRPELGPGRLHRRSGLPLIPELRERKAEVSTEEIERRHP